MSSPKDIGRRAGRSFAVRAVVANLRLPWWAIRPLMLPAITCAGLTAALYTCAALAYFIEVSGLGHNTLAVLVAIYAILAVVHLGHAAHCRRCRRRWGRHLAV